MRSDPLWIGTRHSQSVFFFFFFFFFCCFFFFTSRGRTGTSGDVAFVNTTGSRVTTGNYCLVGFPTTTFSVVPCALHIEAYPVILVIFVVAVCLGILCSTGADSLSAVYIRNLVARLGRWTFHIWTVTCPLCASSAIAFAFLHIAAVALPDTLELRTIIDLISCLASGLPIQSLATTPCRVVRSSRWSQASARDAHIPCVSHTMKIRAIN
mmetsp:Transcript_7925/g.14929  ORF Transcript_7925/g.14929 Transcript_7925/m.14929 type:complete len:210 (+) Transcript_7925:85-714(+)